MAGDSVSKVGKPQLRGLLQASIKRNLILAIAFSAAGAVALKVCMGDARKKKYAEFYKTYNPDEAFERMRKAGVMSCASP